MELHFLTVTGGGAIAGLDGQHFRSAHFTAVSLAKLSGHVASSKIRASYFLGSMGWPQWDIVPAPPLVTINSAPHLVQTYRLPIWFAMLSHRLLRTGPVPD